MEQIGKKFGLTRERIRQIESRAKKKLLKYADKGKLEDYLNWSAEENIHLICESLNLYIFTRDYCAGRIREGKWVQKRKSIFEAITDRKTDYVS